MLTPTNHAVDKAAERHIQLEEIQQAVDNLVEGPIPGNREDTVVYVGVTDTGRRLQLVVADDDCERIVSVWALRPMRRRGSR